MWPKVWSIQLSWCDLFLVACVTSCFPYFVVCNYFKYLNVCTILGPNLTILLLIFQWLRCYLYYNFCLEYHFCWMLHPDTIEGFRAGMLPFCNFGKMRSKFWNPSLLSCYYLVLANSLILFCSQGSAFQKCHGTD